MKHFRKAVWILCVFAMSFTNAAAANYTPVKGTSTSFAKYFVLKESAKVPDAEFTFTIEPGNAQTYSDSRMEVLAGVGQPVIGTAVFTEGETASSVIAPGDSVTLDEGEKYAKKTVTVDFGQVSFDEPGIYRYIVKENEIASRNDIAYDTDAAAPGSKTRYLDVYVIDENGSLQVDAYVLHESESEIALTADNGSLHEPSRLEDKSDGFVNRYLTQDLTFAKKVSGNQGSKDKYFEFTLHLEGAQPSMTYEIDLENAEGVSGSNSATIEANTGKNNPSSLTVDAEGKGTWKFYLKHGQSVRIQGLPKTTDYALTENEEDYLSLPGIEETNPDPVSGTVESKDLFTGFTNVRDGIIPTGVLIPVSYGALLIGLGAAVLLRKRREE